MFWFGFIVGAVSATVFILYGNGEMLIKLCDQIKNASDRFWESRKEIGRRSCSHSEFKHLHAREPRLTRSAGPEDHDSLSLRMASRSPVHDNFPRQALISSWRLIFTNSLRASSTTALFVLMPVLLGISDQLVVNGDICPHAMPLIQCVYFPRATHI